MLPSLLAGTIKKVDGIFNIMKRALCQFVGVGVWLQILMKYMQIR